METDLTDLLGRDAPQPIPSIMGEPDLSRLLGITAARTRTLARDGVLVRAGRGKYDVRASLAAYLGQLRTHAARAGRPSDGGDALKQARTRLAEEQAQLTALKVAQANSELVSAAEVTRQWETTLTDIRAALLAIPGRLQGIDRETMTRVDGEIRAVLMELAANG